MRLALPHSEFVGCCGADSEPPPLPFPFRLSGCTEGQGWCKALTCLLDECKGRAGELSRRG
eukprot:2505698-Rhodomonas_salina.1